MMRYSRIASASPDQSGNQDPAAEACQRLWRHVLLAQWQLATRERAPCDLTRRSDYVRRIIRIQEDARDWFGSNDCEVVCLFAGVDVDEMRRRLAARIGAKGADLSAISGPAGTRQARAGQERQHA
ncbi:hypothetical protein [Halodurantibacterium flavum]|uniref:Uncharacterized protein n=1 Tax=Halodurantibacterium flavum TaxID=1382802 RepID=A0ABW4S898_9RHOB